MQAKASRFDWRSSLGTLVLQPETAPADQARARWGWGSLVDLMRAAPGGALLSLAVEEGDGRLLGIDDAKQRLESHHLDDRAKLGGNVDEDEIAARPP